ncbi:hypothetical protein M885DRAFT_558071, partial [Pelagophyceae sp. CCMP2097]
MASWWVGEVVEAPDRRISMKEELRAEFAAELMALRAEVAAAQNAGPLALMRHAEPPERAKGVPQIDGDGDYGPATADDGDPPKAFLDDDSDRDATTRTGGHEAVKIEASCWSIPLVAGVAGLGGRTLAVLL